MPFRIAPSIPIPDPPATQRPSVLALSEDGTISWGDDTTKPSLRGLVQDKENTKGKKVRLTLPESYSKDSGEPYGTGALTYSIADLPSGLSFNTLNRIVSGTIADDAMTSSPLYKAMDSKGNVSEEPFEWRINDAPTLPAQDDLSSVPVGTELTVALPAASGGTGAITYALSGYSGSGAYSYNAATRVMSLTPDDEDAGTTVTMTYTATDEDGIVATETFDIAFST